MIANALWNYSPDSQIHKLGDRHLILLMAAWYHLFDETIVRPARNAGKTVITDQWIYKYLARFRAKDIYWAGSYFDGLSEANGVLLLDVPPEVGATRKTHFKHTESESCESGTESGFITFQKKVLLEFVQFQNSSWHTINGDQDPDIVIDQALKIVIRLQQ
jgi:thymidylate kinase